jgi:apolipoprotein D and lipocalin family protein
VETSVIRSAVLALALALSVSSPASAAAPQPSKRVELSSYSGRWFEIARIPNRLQRGCIAASVDYAIDNNRVRAVQRCTPAGDKRARIYRSSGRILDPGVNTKTKLTFAGFWSQEYWVIDHSADWALVGDPSGRFLWIMSRAPSLSAPQRDAAVARVSALGYEAQRLEFTGIRN